MAVMGEDERALTAAQGVGKRLAQRIILELRDKLGKQQDELAIKQSGAAVPAAAAGQSMQADLMSALTVLGYTRAECAAAIRGLDLESMSLEEAIRAALRAMMK